jgi:medium-chain acyl-[acyl-carrier-protein] hydrolase
MLCFPYAGASSAVYRDWREPLAGVADVVPVEMPGHGRRRSEALAQSMPELVEALWSQAEPYVSGPLPYVLYGHSLGALAAFELAHAFTAAEHPPAVLIVSGRNGPSHPAAVAPMHQLPDEEFLAALASFGGTPLQFLTDHELMRLFLPTLRADLGVAERYHRPHVDPLPCPLLSLQSADDKFVSPGGVSAWAQETGSDHHLIWCTGDHFFPYRSQTARLHILDYLTGGAIQSSSCADFYRP